MTAGPEWLPQLVRMRDSGGDWGRFLAELYNVFYRDFRMAKPRFRGLPIVYDMAISEGKEAGFWHVISEVDRGTGQRNVDPRRCERIGWIDAIIEHAHDARVSIWKNRRGSHERVLLWLEEEDYLVVLEEKAHFFVLVTAYCTDLEPTRRKLRRERDSFQKRQAPP